MGHSARHCAGTSRVSYNLTLTCSKVNAFPPSLCHPGHRCNSVQREHWSPSCYMAWLGLAGAAESQVALDRLLVPPRPQCLSPQILIYWATRSFLPLTESTRENAAVLPFLGLSPAWRSRHVFSRPVSRESTCERSRLSDCGATPPR